MEKGGEGGKGTGFRGVVVSGSRGQVVMGVRGVRGSRGQRR